jgi:adenylate cyclase
MASKCLSLWSLARGEGTVATGEQLWGEDYTRNATDASLVQSSIVRDVAAQLRPRLGRSEQDSLAKVQTKDAEAYRLYLQGRSHFEKWTSEDLEAAVEFFSNAVRRDENYAAAYAGLADGSAIQGYFGNISGSELKETDGSQCHGLSESSFHSTISMPSAAARILG